MRFLFTHLMLKRFLFPTQTLEIVFFLVLKKLGNALIFRLP